MEKNFFSDCFSKNIKLSEKWKRTEVVACEIFFKNKGQLDFSVIEAIYM